MLFSRSLSFLNEQSPDLSLPCSNYSGYPQGFHSAVLGILSVSPSCTSCSCKLKLGIVIYFGSRCLALLLGSILAQYLPEIPGLVTENRLRGAVGWEMFPVFFSCVLGSLPGARQLPTLNIFPSQLTPIEVLLFCVILAEWLFDSLWYSCVMHIQTLTSGQLSSKDN